VSYSSTFYIKFSYLCNFPTFFKLFFTFFSPRNFVLNDDLALDYDIGGLAVSATFLINIMVFVVLLVQVRFLSFVINC
jgi:hypothetical protein